MNLQHFFTQKSWWGKLLGALLGYLVAGPIGTLFGILIGNLFDRGLAEHFTSPYWHFYGEKRKIVQQLFLETTFSVMGHIAKADGRVSEEEIKLAKTLMDEMYLNSTQKKAAQHYFNQGKKADFSLRHVLLLFKEAVQHNPKLIKLFIDIQYRAAQAGGLSAPKMQALDQVLSFMGFAPLHKQYRFYEDFVDHSAGKQQSSNKQSYYSPSHLLDQAYAILEIPNTASKLEVKRAYRRLMSRNHPDKLTAKGLPDSMIKLANEKTQKIRKAYEKICESKGW